MTALGTNRQLLQYIGVAIPEGAVSFWTDRKRPDPAVIFFVGGEDEAVISSAPLTDHQRSWLYQQNRFGSLGWNLDEK